MVKKREVKCCLIPVFALFLASLAISSVHATDANYSLSVTSGIEISISTNTVTLNLNPNSKEFDHGDLDINVSTNNPSGYTLTMSSENTSLTRDSSLDGKTATLPTLDNTYIESVFPANKWGYKVGTDITTQYKPFVSGATIKETNRSTNIDTTTLRFGAKVDYGQIAGTYSGTLTLAATANSGFTNMQDFTTEMCQRLASDNDYTLVDSRDGQEYTVRYLADNCWMTSNLRFGLDESNPDTTEMRLSPDSSNVTEDQSFTAYDLVTYGTSTAKYNECYFISSSGYGYTTPCMHSKYTTNGNDTIGVWYNYAAASAGTITGYNNNTTASQDICPKGWKLPGGMDRTRLVNVIGSSPSPFNPVYGGYYVNSVLYGRDNVGGWWADSAYDSQTRTYLRYQSGGLSGSYNERMYGRYVRCILKKS